jgi:rod shape determining protein RodA
MNSFTGESRFFERQAVWAGVSAGAYLIASLFDFRFLRRTGVLAGLFVGTVGALLLLFVVGTVAKGAQSWFALGSVALQPSEFAKLVLILLLAKYFSRRHVEIAHYRHIFVSGFYAFVLFVLVFLQPDFGSAIIIFSIWFGMVLVSGLSKKHLVAVFLVGAVTFGALWAFVFQDYQKERIMTFVHPLADIQGSGYNAYQSMVAVGSGGLLGKGIGYGTQSKLQFLPEYETDFIFAAFAEEWGFVGVLILFGLYAVVIWRIILTALRGATNFETLFGLGVAVMFIAHFIIHVGMNIGLLPVTGTTIPFMSYGGTHLLVEFLSLGVLAGMRRYSLPAHRDDAKNEFLGA